MRRRRELPSLLLALACLLLTAHADAGVRRIWAVNDGEKVERDATNHPRGARNSAWDGHVIHVFGARNEIVAFQVIVEADARGIERSRCRLPAARVGSRPHHLPPPGRRSDRLRRRPIQIFAAHYMHVTTPSHASWVYDARIAGGALPIPRDGSRCSSCRRTRARGRGGFPLAVGAQPEPGDLDRDLHRPRPRARSSTEARSRCAPTRRGGRSRSSSRSSISRCRTRTACTRCCITRAIRPSCIRAATSMPPITGWRTGTASSWCMPTTNARCARRGTVSRARTSRAIVATKGRGRASATCSRRGRSTGPGRDFDDRPQRLGAAATPG